MTAYRNKYLMHNVNENRVRNGLLYTKKLSDIKPDYESEHYSEDESHTSVGQQFSYKLPEFKAFKPEKRSTVSRSGGTKPTNPNGVKAGEKYKIGDVTVTVTDPYGTRSFEGREGEHSTGVDMKTSSGKVVAIRDGVIQQVKLQGDGSVIKPTQGHAAGYYLVVKHSDGTMAQYMHLDPPGKGGLSEMKKQLEGKQIKRGDQIWGYTTGSGSMTGPHVKFRLYKGNSKNHFDPSKYFRN